MDAVEEEGIFYASGYTVGSFIGAKGLDKLGKAAKVAVQGTKLSSILKTATCVDDLLNAGVSTIDDLVNIGVKSVDDLLKVGVNTLDDLAKVGIHSIDDLVKVGATSADDLAKLGITSVEQLKKIGITSMDDLAKLGITSKEELAKVGVKSADDFIKGEKKIILSYEEAEDIAFSAIKGKKNSDTVVLGKYEGSGSTSYTSVAKDMNAQYFQLDNWDKLSAKYSNDEIWKINQKFLEIQTSSGREIYLSHNPANYIGDGSFYSREIQYLLDNGYKFIDEGGIWHAVR